MTNYFTKELNTKDQKKSARFAEEVEKIKSEIKQLKEQQTKANTRIPEIKRELSQLVTDVDVITNDSKRKKVLKDKAKLQEELNEWELYAAMDIDSYKAKRLDGIYELGVQAAKEYREYSDQAMQLLIAVRKELDDKEQEVMAAKNRLHPFVKYQSTVITMRNKRQAEKLKAEREEQKKKTIHVDSNGNQIVGTMNWSD